MTNFLEGLIKNPVIISIAIAVCLDMVLGVLRAIKEGKFNSSAGIDGAIRKVAMLVCVVTLAGVDTVIHFNLLFMIPKEWITVIGLKNVGLCELFAILFTLFEFASILKNMVLCGLPVPDKVKAAVIKFLENMTGEMPKITKEVKQ